MGSSERTSWWARVGVVLMAVGALVLLVGVADRWGSGGSPQPPNVEPAPDPAVPIQPEGFTTIDARIVAADGEVCEVCLWLADTSDERGRGLMGVTDLGDAAGMVFRYDEPVDNTFYMLNTPTPLSIAWFGPLGDFVASTDMAPCLEIPEGGCPRYSPGVPYVSALEVFEGELADLGVGPGARLELIDGSEADTCPTTP